MEFEGRRNRGGLSPFTDQPAIAASTQSKAQTIEDDRLARPGFAGEDGQPLGEGKIEVVDQNDVADRKSH